MTKGDGQTQSKDGEAATSGTEHPRAGVMAKEGAVGGGGGGREVSRSGRAAWAKAQSERVRSQAGGINPVAACAVEERWGWWEGSASKSLLGSGVAWPGALRTAVCFHQGAGSRCSLEAQQASLSSPASLSSRDGLPLSGSC